MEANMDTCRLRVKIGPYEMEAEGPRDFVEQHYSSFSERIPQSSQLAVVPKAAAGATEESEPATESEYSSIFKVEGRYVIITAPPTGDERELEGFLLVLLGHKEMRGEDLVSADVLLYGMRQSGINIERADRLADRAQGQNLINRTGVRRGTQYRLTSIGIQRARVIAREQMTML
jgi:hypothetical protein